MRRAAGSTRFSLTSAGAADFGCLDKGGGLTSGGDDLGAAGALEGLVLTARGYHIDFGPGEVAPWILLVGDPERAARVAARFERVRVSRTHREYVGHTGSHAGLEVTVLGTGIGCDNTEIAVVELLECLAPAARPTFIRIGSCGALDESIAPGDLVVSTGAVRLESTSLAYVEEGHPAIAHHEVVLALLSAAAEAGHRHHLGLTATAAGFYGWQGRAGGRLEGRFPDLVARLRRMQVRNFEMEASTLFTLAGLMELRAGAVCSVFANRVIGADLFLDAGARQAAEERAIDVGLLALRHLARMDESAGSAPFRLPPLGGGGGPR